MMLSAVEGHRLWAPSYDSAPNPLLSLEDRVLPGLLGKVRSRRVVDVACGTGRWTSRLAAQGAEVFGVDLCDEMLSRAVQKPALAGRVALAEAGALPLAAATADLALCSFAVGYFAGMPQSVAELARITRPGGRMVLSDLHPDSVAAGWTRSFRAGGTVVEMRHYGHSVGAILRAARSAGLKLKTQEHVPFGGPEQHFFSEAGKPMPRIPALWIALWTR